MTETTANQPRVVDGISEDTGMSLGKDASTSSRPPPRNLTLLDVPDELLVAISKKLVIARHWEDEFSSCGPPQRDIMTLRLTCRRLCNVSSHLLLRNVAVRRTAKSLSRLDDISQHPTIRQGVRCIQIDVSFYALDLARSIYSFSHLVLRRMRLQNFGYPHRGQMPPGGSDGMTPEEEGRRKSIQRANTILQSFQNFIDGTQSDDPEILGYQRVLREAHTDYQERFAEQERLTENGFFYGCLASAVCRMPRATSFDFCDYDTARWKLKPFYEGETGDNTSLIEVLRRPYDWIEAKRFVMDAGPMEVLIRVPDILHKAGVTISSLRYPLSLYDSHVGFKPNAEDLRNLKSAAQNLKTLHLGQRFRAYASWREGWLKHFMNAVLDTASVEEIELNLGFLCPEQPADLPLRRSLHLNVFAREYPKLRTLTLASVAIHQAELGQLLRTSTPSLVSLTLILTPLLSGTWEEALDLLRKKNLLFIYLRDPVGAECDWLPSVNIEEVFSNLDQNSTTKAEKYVLGICDSNPLKVLENLATGIS